jgi:hypothetical protein
MRLTKAAWGLSVALLSCSAALPLDSAYAASTYTSRTPSSYYSHAASPQSHYSKPSLSPPPAFHDHGDGHTAGTDGQSNTVQRQGDYSKPGQSQAPPAAQQQSPPAGTAQRQGDFTKPGQPQAPAASTAQRQGDFTKPGQQPAGVVARQTPPPPRSASDVAIAKGHSKMALTQFDNDQKKYRQPPVSAPASQQAARQSAAWHNYGTRWRSADDYYAARSAAYARLPPQVQVIYVHPPVWVSNGPPAYGSWAAPFLGGMLVGASVGAYDNWAYSHWSDPGVIAWRQSMAQQAQDNAELRAQLDTLNQRVADLQAQHAPVTDALPDGIDPALAVAPETVMLATAKSGFNWWWIWTPLIAIVLVIGFGMLCISISRNRQRLA